ncbi:MAG TPA: helix-turn-helix domain-containing protein [Rhizomicrobium sp.]|jgi:putative transcriptional regulator
MRKKTSSSIIAGAREALAIVKGEADPSTYRIHVPEEIDVKKLRDDLGMTQQVFCKRYGFGLARVKDWEQGRSQPDQAVRAYLKIIRTKPKMVRKILEDA